MILLYSLLRGLPTETADPSTKERYGIWLVLNVLGRVLTAVVELLMATVALDVLSDGHVASELKECLVDYVARGLVFMAPVVGLLIAALMRGELLVER